MEIHSLTAHFGAEIRDVDLSQDVDQQTFDAIERTFNEKTVLLFRNQQLTEEQFVRFSRRFGQLEIHTMREFVRPDHPEIFVLSNIVENGKPVGNKDAGGVWHTDLSYMKAPSRGSLLHAIEIPHADSGESLGNTLFASSAYAYESLPQTMKLRLQDMHAVHGLWERHEKDRIAAGQAHMIITDPLRRAQVPDVVHPIVRTHPFTGRKCLYVNEGQTTRIVGLPEQESRALLEELFAHSTRPAYVYRHQWRVNDLVMWDNCAALHRVCNDYQLPQRRLMHRTTLRGSEVS
jgi:taurine dioxygenase